MSQLLNEDKKYLLNVYKRLDLEIDKAEGSYLFDKKGNKYLDIFSGIAVNALGQNQDVKEVMKSQVDKYLHLSNYFASRPVIELAKLLVENSFASKVFFSNSGSEANEAAIKLARLYAKNQAEDKIEFLAATDGFHGRTMGSLSLTGREKYRKQFKPLLPEVNHYNFNDSQDLEKKVSKKTAAVFIEIIQGEGGIHEVDKEFINKLVKLRKKYNFLIIVDEIQSGIGRSGDFFAYEKYDFRPDLVTLAKSLGGGLPLGALLVSEKLEDVFSYGEHGSTFGGNPLACAAGKKVVERILDEKFQKELIKKSNYLLSELNNLKDKFPEIIKEIRGRGFILGIECGDYAKIIKKEALKRNLLLNVTDNTVIRLLPPLNINKIELNKFLNILENILEKLR